jgi:Right handed beta helix region/Phospholipase_D-nuclease N-terminal
MLLSRSHELFHRKKRSVFALFLPLLVCLLPLFLLVGCSGSTIATPTWPSTSYSLAMPASKGTGPHWPAATLRVPEDYPTMSDAVKAAKPGDLISVAPGIYHETVIVHTPDLTIRGRNRNTVILDGNFTMPNGILATANDVVLENMTARHYVGNGFYWYNVHGYRGSYLTAYAIGDYGIYAYLSVDGQFDHDYAAGSPNGFYIGACHPCNAVVTEVLAEDNGLGYSGTNAGGNLVIENSIWRENVVGIAPNTEDSEPLAPQDGVTIIHNLVENNNNYYAPVEAEQLATIGTGIIIAGGSNDVIEDNRVNGEDYYGILVVANVDQNVWEPHGNMVKENVVTNSGIADLALAALSADKNCFSDNTVSRTSPPFLQYTHACGSLLDRAGGGDPSAAFYLMDHYTHAQLGYFQPRSWRTFPNPTLQQPGMPDPTIAPQGIFANLGGYTLDMTVSSTTVHPGLTLGGLGLATPAGEIILGFYLYLLPIALYAAWFGVGTWDLIRRTDLKGGARIGWLAVIYLVPVLGPLAYFLFGRSEIQRSTRWVLALGAPLAYVIIAVVLLLLVP